MTPLHVTAVDRAKAALETGRQVLRKLLQQFFPVRGAILPVVLEFHDLSAHCPIRGRHEGIDGAGDGAASHVEHFTYTTEQTKSSPGRGG